LGSRPGFPYSFQIQLQNNEPTYRFCEPYLKCTWTEMALKICTLIREEPFRYDFTLTDTTTTPVSCPFPAHFIPYRPSGWLSLTPFLQPL
jgi:hypothetical protein